MNLIRTFISISFPDEVVAEMARIQELVGKKNFTGKLTELKNLHLTLKFIGEIDETLLDKVKERLSKINFREMELRLGDLGTFAKNGNPRIVWIKIEGKELWDLQKEIDENMESLGLRKEERFMSHVTLARVKYVKDKKDFRESIKSIKPKKLSFEVKEFQLKKSELGKMGPIYCDIAVYNSNPATP